MYFSELVYFGKALPPNYQSCVIVCNHHGKICYIGSFSRNISALIQGLIKFHNFFTQSSSQIVYLTSRPTFLMIVFTEAIFHLFCKGFYYRS